MKPSDVSPEDVFTTMLHAIDDLDWDAFRASFAPQIALDYTSLWGGEPESVSVVDLMASWQQLAHGFDATQHLTGSIVVTSADDLRATCRTTVRAYHHIVDDDRNGATWMVAGQYTVGLLRGADRWTIDAITLRVHYEDGDRALVDIARQRTTTGVGGRTNSANSSKESRGREE